MLSGRAVVSVAVAAGAVKRWSVLLAVGTVSSVCGLASSDTGGLVLGVSAEETAGVVRKTPQPTAESSTISTETAASGFWYARIRLILPLILFSPNEIGVGKLFFCRQLLDAASASRDSL